MDLEFLTDDAGRRVAGIFFHFDSCGWYRVLTGQLLGIRLDTQVFKILQRTADNGEQR